MMLNTLQAGRPPGHPLPLAFSPTQAVTEKQKQVRGGGGGGGG